jgi:hypothetical protein
MRLPFRRIAQGPFAPVVLAGAIVGCGDGAAPVELRPVLDGGLDATPPDGLPDGGGHAEPDAGEPDGGRGDAGWPGASTLIEDPLGELPALLSEVGLFVDMLQREPAPEARRYRPAWELWSNGSEKERHILLGGPIDNGLREAWDFAPGTLVFKTFLYEDAAEAARPLETRLIRRHPSGWDYAVYQWNDAGTDATLLPPDRAPIPVPVSDAAGETFEHVIPSTYQCRTCHESGTAVVLGFTELQLSGTFEGSAQGDLSQLEQLAEAGWLRSSLPASPDVIEHADPETRFVLGYLQGNCTHCHNGGSGPSSSFDLRHGVALDALIDEPTASSASAGGIRVVPGDPDASVLYQAISSETAEGGLMLMPPLGVERRDADAISRIRSWIAGLEF